MEEKCHMYRPAHLQGIIMDLSQDQHANSSVYMYIYTYIHVERNRTTCSIKSTRVQSIYFINMCTV